MDLKTLLHTSFLFWVVLDPLGNIPIVLSTLHSFDPKRQRTIIWRELFLSLIVMIIFLFFGIGFFSLLQINTASLQMAGGLLLFLLAIRMIFSRPKTEKESSVPPNKEPFLVPIAVPAIAGPGILSMISLYGGSAIESKMTTLVAILVAWAATIPFLLVSSFLKNWLGENGLVAAERLFGYIIVLLSIQMSLEALTRFFV